MSRYIPPKRKFIPPKFKKGGGVASKHAPHVELTIVQILPDPKYGYVYQTEKVFYYETELIPFKK